MKNKLKSNPIIRIFAFISIIVFMAVVIAIGMYYYLFSIPEPEGLSLASWPNRFTDNFSYWMQYEDGIVSVKESGLKKLDEYGLWVQIIDETGREVFSYKKPENYPASYSASELMSFGTSVYEDGNTVFVGSFEDSDQTWGYIVGFPYAIGKYMLYYNGENVGRLSPVFWTVIILVFCAASILVLVYGFWLTRQLGKITNGIDNISLRTYQPLKETGTFRSIYEALNKMDREIKHSDKAKEETDRVRREWITNITHDLKTPLSPIKGYAELLAEGSKVDDQAVQEYGAIILKNVNHTERLINDLKLTYQLESGAILYNPKEVRFVRYLREMIIDIANDPTFSCRNIEFECESPEFIVSIDPDLFRRAIQNIVINALVHNPSDTKVNISVMLEKENSIYISVRDNGVGISNAEQKELFTRYYRGTNTKEKTEGSGLGLAIAKQIIMLHGGDIMVESTLGAGSEFIIRLPKS